MEKRILIGTLVLPILVVVLLSIIIFGNPGYIIQEIFRFKNNLILTADDFPRLYEIIMIVISVYAVIVSSIFSFLLYKITKKGTETTEQLAKIEINNQVEQIKVAATIIDMDIVYTLSTLSKWYAKDKYDKLIINMPYIQFNQNYREYVGKIIKVVETKEERSLGYELNHLYYMANLYNSYSKEIENIHLKDTLSMLCRELFNDKVIKESCVSQLHYSPLITLRPKYNNIISTLNEISLAESLDKIKLQLKKYGEER